MEGFLSFLTLPACLHQNQLRNPINHRKMAGKMTTTFVMFTLFAMLHFGYVQSNPAIATGYESMEICIENCAQCKKMLGAWFEGPLCAESCIKFKGKLIPECEDFASIAPFLNKL